MPIPGPPPGYEPEESWDCSSRPWRALVCNVALLFCMTFWCVLASAILQLFDG